MVKATLSDIAVASDGSYFLMLLSTDGGDIVPISIDPLQAQAIVIGQSHEKFERPLTHDLLLSVIEMLDAKLKRIEIPSLEAGIYYSRLVLEAKGIEYDIDARPSDAVALAVRGDVDLFIAEEVIEQVGMTDDFGGSGGVEA